MLQNRTRLPQVEQRGIIRGPFVDKKRKKENGKESGAISRDGIFVRSKRKIERYPRVNDYVHRLDRVS